MPEQPNRVNKSLALEAENESAIHAISADEILSGLSSAEAEAIINSSMDKRYVAGDYVYQVEERQKGVYLVKKGRVEEFRLTPGGQRLPISQIGPSQFFGISTTQTSYCCFAVASEESVVAFFSFELLERIFQRHPKVGVNLVRWFAHRLGEMEERIEALAFSHLRARVARSLLNLSVTQKTSFVDVTHERLAEWVSASRPRISQLLQEFQQKGVIQLSRGEIRIQDLAQLEQWAKEIM